MAKDTQGAFRVVRLEAGKDTMVPRLTGRGAAVLAASLMMILAGLLTRDGDLAAMGIAGIVLLPMFALWCWWNTRHLELSADLPHKVVAEEIFECRIRMGNAGGSGDAFHMRVELQLPGGGTLRFHAPWTPAGGYSEVTMQGSVPRRGVFGGAKAKLTSTFPLGFFSVTGYGNLPDTMAVMPRPLLPVDLGQTIDVMECEENHQEQSRMPVLGELHGLRAYRPGDSMKFVHWPMSTRGMGLVVREYDRPQLLPKLAVVIFHSQARGEQAAVKIEHFEIALRLLAGTLFRLSERGIPTEVWADFHDWQPARCGSLQETGRFHAGLAKVKRAKRADLEGVRRVLHAVPANAMLVVVSDMPVASWKEPILEWAGKLVPLCIEPGYHGKVEMAQLKTRAEVVA